VAFKVIYRHRVFKTGHIRLFSTKQTFQNVNPEFQVNNILKSSHREHTEDSVLLDCHVVKICKDLLTFLWFVVPPPSGPSISNKEFSYVEDEELRCCRNFGNYQSAYRKMP